MPAHAAYIAKAVNPESTFMAPSIEEDNKGGVGGKEGVMPWEKKSKNEKHRRASKRGNDANTDMLFEKDPLFRMLAAMDETCSPQKPATVGGLYISSPYPSPAHQSLTLSACLRAHLALVAQPWSLQSDILLSNGSTRVPLRRGGDDIRVHGGAARHPTRGVARAAAPVGHQLHRPQVGLSLPDVRLNIWTMLGVNVSAIKWCFDCKIT
jgi:hypothetical protein